MLLPEDAEFWANSNCRLPAVLPMMMDPRMMAGTGVVPTPMPSAVPPDAVRTAFQFALPPALAANPPDVQDPDAPDGHVKSIFKSPEPMATVERALRYPMNIQVPFAVSGRNSALSLTSVVLFVTDWLAPLNAGAGATPCSSAASSLDPASRADTAVMVLLGQAQDRGQPQAHVGAGGLGLDDAVDAAGHGEALRRARARDVRDRHPLAREGDVEGEVGGAGRPQRRRGIRRRDRQRRRRRVDPRRQGRPVGVAPAAHRVVKDDHLVRALGDAVQLQLVMEPAERLLHPGQQLPDRVGDDYAEHVEQLQVVADVEL